MTKKSHIISVFLVSLMVSSVLLNVSTTAKTGNGGPKTKVYVYPKMSSYPKLRIGDEFKIDVKINNVDNLYAYEFKLKYDPEILEFVGISSSFLDNGFKLEKTDETKVWYVTSSMYPANPKTGSGTLATITFRVKGIGKSSLDIYDTKLLNSDVKRIKHIVKNGYFKNGPAERGGEVLGENLETSEEPIQDNTGFAEMAAYSTETNGGLEVCDRIDNDDDGHIDEPDVCLPGDVDHYINETNYYNIELEDLVIIGESYGSENGTERYDNICVNNGMYCDLNDDWVVDIFDLAKVGINYGKTQLAGCVDVTVEGSGPIPGAEVFVVGGDSLGITNSSGQVTRCCLLDSGDYFVNASYSGDQVGEDTPLNVDETGAGNTTIIGSCVIVTVYVEPISNDPLYYATIENAYGIVAYGWTDGSGDFKACLENDMYVACAEKGGLPECSNFFIVPDTTSVTITFP